MTDFIQRLRMNNIFGNAQPLGMPDFNSSTIDPISLIKMIHDMKLTDQNNALNRASMDEALNKPITAPVLGANRVAQIGSSMLVPGQPPPAGMNTAVGPGVDNRNPIDVFENGGLTPIQAANLDLSKQKLEQSGNIAAGKQSVAEQRAAIEKFKAEHPGMKILTPKGGNFQFMNPVDGSIIDSNISTGTFTDEEQSKIRGEQQINAIDEKGKEDRKTGEQRGNQRLGEIAASISGKKEIEANKPISETQQAAKIKNNYNRMQIDRPDLAALTVVDPVTKAITIKPEVTDATKKLIEDYLYNSNPGKSEPVVKVDVKPAKKPVAGKVEDPLGIR